MFSSNITGLTGATEYHVRAYATNNEGTGYGTDMSFTTLGSQPVSITLEASDITITSVTLNGAVNANYLSTTVTFEYGKTEAYESTITAIQSPVTNHDNTAVSAAITDLDPGTTYHYRVKSVNSLGTTTGSDMTFKTLGQTPTATTQGATNINTTRATLNGLVNANYLNTTVTFEFGTTIDYGIVLTPTTNLISGYSDTEVSISVIELNPGTVYHFRIKSANVLGVVYGGDVSFTTLGSVPSVTTKIASNITNTTATLNATVNANYLSTTVLFEYGLTTSYGTSIPAIQSPASGNNNIDVSVNITGLTLNTEYHFRLVATNELGATISSDMTFLTTVNGLTGTVTDIEGNSYQTIGIGYRIWMAENLKTTKFNNNTNIPKDVDWTNLISPSYCWYNNDEDTYKSIYGALYNWHTINTGKLCPIGWHVPCESEWEIMITYLGGSSIAGGKLKEAGLIHWNYPNAGATNESGFKALPAGYRDYNGGFAFIGYLALWWSLTENSETHAWYLYVVHDFANIVGYSREKHNGYSVRCVKDE